MKSILQTSLCVAALFWVAGAGWAAVGSRPAFVGNLQPSNQGVVQRLVEGRDVDLVVLNGGWFEGIQVGMNCELMDGAARVAELIVIDAWVDGAVALILQVEEDERITPGQVARPKLISATF